MIPTRRALNFKADGSFIHGGSVNTSGCGTGSNESGTAVASGTTLTAHVTAGATSVCGHAPMDTFVPNTKEFTYTIRTIHLDQGDQLLLTLTNLACVTKNGSDTWCIDKFTRQ